VSDDEVEEVRLEYSDERHDRVDEDELEEEKCFEDELEKNDDFDVNCEDVESDKLELPEL
jgi:hypothetical protein